jgi:hypothetical protein
MNLTERDMKVNLTGKNVKSEPNKKIKVKKLQIPKNLTLLIHHLLPYLPPSLVVGGLRGSVVRLSALCSGDRGFEFGRRIHLHFWQATFRLLRETEHVDPF